VNPVWSKLTYVVLCLCAQHKNQRFESWGTYTILHLWSGWACWLDLFMSLLSSYHREERSELSCIYERFCFCELFSSCRIVSPTIWRPFFLLSLRYSVSWSHFSSSWEETHLTWREFEKLPIRPGTKGSCCDVSQ